MLAYLDSPLPGVNVVCQASAVELQRGVPYGGPDMPLQQAVIRVCRTQG